MPKQKNIIQFSLNEEQLGKLEALVQNNESLGLCAKRLVLEIIDPSEEITLEQAENLDDRLSQLEEKFSDLDQVCDRLFQLEHKLNEGSLSDNLSNNLSNNLSTQQQPQVDLEQKLNHLQEELNASVTHFWNRVEKLEEVTKLAYPTEPNLGHEIEAQWGTLEELSDRLGSLENLVEVLLRQQSEGKALTNAQLGKRLKVNISTVNQWAKKGFHEDWRYDPQTKLWTKDETR